MKMTKTEDLETLAKIAIGMMTRNRDRAKRSMEHAQKELEKTAAYWQKWLVLEAEKK